MSLLSGPSPIAAKTHGNTTRHIVAVLVMKEVQFQRNTLRKMNSVSQLTLPSYASEQDNFIPSLNLNARLLLYH